jgi:hypothetical protein
VIDVKDNFAPDGSKIHKECDIYVLLAKYRNDLLTKMCRYIERTYRKDSGERKNAYLCNIIARSEDKSGVMRGACGIYL